MNRDSLGVPMEPEDKEVALDWNENALYADDIVYVTEDGLVKAESDEVIEYMDTKYPDKLSIEEYEFVLKGE